MKPKSITSLPNLPRNKARQKGLEDDAKKGHTVANVETKHKELKNQYLAYSGSTENKPKSGKPTGNQQINAKMSQ